MEEKRHRVCWYYDLINSFMMFKVFCISYVSCQSFVDTDFLLFLKDLKHLSMSSSWTPRYLRKVSWIYFFLFANGFWPCCIFSCKLLFLSALFCGTWCIRSLSLQTKVALTVEIWNPKQCPLHTAGRMS